MHLAPAFGADDMETSRAHGLPVVNPVRPDGRFEEWIPLVGGMFFKDADEPLIRDLTERGVLFRVEQYEHSYPHCWRCHTPLLYYALPSWYIRTTQVKDLMLAENERTNWQPPTIQHGRYGEWLRNNVDWALSRTRYWGTPLPIWECGEQHLTCAGSLAELSELAGRDLSGLDPHRPYVDEVTLTCPECGGEARRVPEVIDAWYDSGSMPFARLGAPWQNAEEFRRTYPAQFICEAIDQTRGWFYSLMAVGSLVFGRNSYENVVCLGLVVDERRPQDEQAPGQRARAAPADGSARRGRDPLVLRGVRLTLVHPADRRRGTRGDRPQGAAHVLEHGRRSSCCTPTRPPPRARRGDRRRPLSAPPARDRPLLDRWLLSELHATTQEVTSSLEGFDTAAAGRRLAAFIDDLSNWYVRRSRRRFWEGPATRTGRRRSPRCMSACTC